MRPAAASARMVALQALRSWKSSERFADAILQDARDRLPEPKDRAFAQELFYGVLRTLRALDRLISELRSGKTEDEIRDLLRLGLYQIFFTRIPPHAAVNETVSLAGRHHRGITNGVLRTALRERERLAAVIASWPLATLESHPDFLVERWEKNFGADNTAALCRWNNQPAPLYARVNTLRLTPEKFLTANEGTEPVPHHPEMIRCDELPRAAIERGECYIQDPSTTLAVRMLAPRPGETILDACAAPGGKSGHLAAITGNEATLVACDGQPARLDRLRENLARLGAKAEIVPHDWMIEPPEKFAFQAFDRILVDAPCSNTGVMRRRVDVRWRLRPDDFSRMQQRQLGILQNVSLLLVVGGHLVYSTCSLESEENEEVAERFATKNPHFTVIESERVLPFRDGYDGAYAVTFQRTA